MCAMRSRVSVVWLQTIHRSAQSPLTPEHPYTYVLYVAQPSWKISNVFMIWKTNCWEKFILQIAWFFMLFYFIHIFTLFVPHTIYEGCECIHMCIYTFQWKIPQFWNTFSFMNFLLFFSIWIDVLCVLRITISFSCAIKEESYYTI